MLQAQRYHPYSSFRPGGADFTADVTENGKHKRVLINPLTNQIQPVA